MSEDVPLPTLILARVTRRGYRAKRTKHLRRVSYRRIYHLLGWSWRGKRQVVYFHDLGCKPQHTINTGGHHATI